MGKQWGFPTHSTDARMPTAEQIKALIRSHAEGDEVRFYAIAMQMAAQEARHGHTRFATDLRDLIDKVKAKRGDGQAPPRQKPVPLVQPRGELAGLLTVSYPKLRVADMALDPCVENSIRRVLLEQRQEQRLRQHGLVPLRKLLLIGPPGTGKTMTAGVLAGELGLPLFLIQFDGLITKYMGETAAKLRLIFDAAQQTRAVYLFDEFDALGGERTSGNDVGEIRRVLNSFLQFLELDESDSLIVGATNHPQILDRALFRRFDTVIEYVLPSREVAEHVMRSRLALLGSDSVDWSKAAASAEGLSHGEIARACEHAAKDAILNQRTSIETASRVEAIQERKNTHNR